MEDNDYNDSRISVGRPLNQYKSCNSENFPVVAKLFLFFKMYGLTMGTVVNVVKRPGVTMATIGSKLRTNGVKSQPHVPSFFL